MGADPNPKRAPRIFLSYRRTDSADVAGRIYDRLAAHFGAESVFMDVDAIPYGVDFRAFLGEWVARSDVLLALVGDGWGDAFRSEERRGSADTKDFVAIEVSAALTRGIPVIPVLVGRATMPGPHELPEALADFAYRHAAEVRSGRDFHGHVDRLIRAIEQDFESRAESALVGSAEDRAAGGEEGSRDVVYVVVEPPAVTEPVNLGFEGIVVAGMPGGWCDSIPFVGGVSTRYRVTVEPRTDSSGMCARLHGEGLGVKEFGSLMQRCPAHRSVGRRLRVEATLRTADLDAWAGLWFRIDGRATHLFFDNMHDRPIRGTTPWTRHAIEADVPPGSEWLNYGILLVGNGTMWADDFTITGR